MFKPGDDVKVIQTTQHAPGLRTVTTVYRTVHGLTYAGSIVTGINTTQGDWFPLDDPSAVTIQLTEDN